MNAPGRIVAGSFGRIAVAVTIASAVAMLPVAAGQGETATIGNRPMIIVSLKTADGPPSHCSNQALGSMYFTDRHSISAYYAENSYGLLKMSGTVAGPYVVNLQKDWSRTSVANEADAAATASGVNLSLYAQRVYILPKEADPNPIQSAWGGQANGREAQLWIRDYWCSSKWVAAHELGHNLGLNHASTPADEYGDFSSSMGGRTIPGSDPSTWNNVPHFNAAGKIAAGWLPASAVQTVTVEGRYRFASVETVPVRGQIQALKIATGRDGTEFIYLSYRQAIGFSSVLTPQYAATTSLTRWDGAKGSKTCLLASLADGQSFSDASGLMVAQDSHDASHAYLTVRFGAAPLSNVRVTCP